MSMAWMRMPGQTWAGAAASFLGMWSVMMVAMMLPSLVPVLRRYRDAPSGAGETHIGSLTALVGVGYFFIWIMFGVAAYLLGVVVTTVFMRQLALARAAPVGIGFIVLVAGVFQFTPWKVRYLGCCRDMARSIRTLPYGPGAAWEDGVRLGLHCGYCCAGLMATLLVLGVMDLRAMAAVGAAITIERLVPLGERAARIIGIVGVGVGLFLIAKATGLG